MDFSKNAFVAIGDNDKREKFENVTLGECDEIKIGMQVRSEEEAYNFYNEYALKKGFSIRKAINIVNSRCWTFFFFFLSFLTGGGKGICFFVFPGENCTSVFTRRLLEAWQVHFVCEGC